MFYGEKKGNRSVHSIKTLLKNQRETDRWEDSSEQQQQLPLYIQSEKIETKYCLSAALHNPAPASSDETM